MIEVLKKDELIEWCWNNLEFYNAPETWEDTYITDILEGKSGMCLTTDEKWIKYSKIREMFTQYYEED